MNLLRPVLSWFKKPLPLVILVETQYASYELHRAFQIKPIKVRVKFFIDEEPWAHKTFIGSAQLRYPSELIALVKNNSVAAVICCDEHALLKYEQYRQRLSELGCLLIQCEEGRSATYIYKEMGLE